MFKTVPQLPEILREESFVQGHRIDLYALSHTLQMRRGEQSDFAFGRDGAQERLDKGTCAALALCPCNMDHVELIQITGGIVHSGKPFCHFRQRGGVHASARLAELFEQGGVRLEGIQRCYSVLGPLDWQKKEKRGSCAGTFYRTFGAAVGTQEGLSWVHDGSR